MASAVQIHKIYAMGARLGMLNSGNKDDELHALVKGITGKAHVSELTTDEYKAIVKELAERLKLSQLEPPPERKRKPKQHPAQPGHITDGQQRKVWALMYQLAKCDAAPSAASLGERLSGIIKRELHIDATERQPMCWVTYEQGNRLIEILKGYVRSAERKAMHSG